ncbi:MAG: signal peptide peptidase SppA [Candidatus Omnitrophica bacterium]|nr:signal peptide peptidase SppA [Candidatus Omnitrophota bacterium]
MAKKINDLFFTRPWAVKEDVFQKMLEIVERHMRGEKLTQEEIEARIGSDKKEKPDYEVINGAAIIPIYGVIAKRVSQVGGVSQPRGTSIEEIKNDLISAMDDPGVEKVILDIDSPGGSVDGIDEFSDYIFNLRRKKPIIAFANGMMASAAYYIGSAADKIYASKSSEVGSIGVYAVINDCSVANHNAGIKTEIIKAGKYKATGHPDKPLTEEDRQLIQEEINTYYGLFVEAIMRNRNMTEDQSKGIATGRTWIGKKALDVGLIDGLTNLPDLIGASEVSKLNVRAEAASSLKHKEKANLTKEERIMEITVEKLKAENKPVAEALITEGKALGIVEGKALGITEGKALGIVEGKASAEAARVAEQVRIDGIMANMPPKMEALALKAIKEGATIEAASALFLKEMKLAAPTSAGANADVETAKEATTPEERLAAEFKASPALQAEFGKEANYIRFKKAEAAGTVKILGKK